MNTTNYNINFFKLKISTERKGENSVRRFQDFRVSNGQQFSFSYRKYQMSVYPSYKYDFSKARSSSQAPSQVTWYHFAHSLHVTHSTSSEVICFFCKKNNISSSSTDVLFYTSSIVLLLKSLLSQNLADCFLFLFLFVLAVVISRHLFSWFHHADYLCLL